MLRSLDRSDVALPSAVRSFCTAVESLAPPLSCQAVNWSVQDGGAAGAEAEATAAAEACADVLPPADAVVAVVLPHPAVTIASAIRGAYFRFMSGPPRAAWSPHSPAPGDAPRAAVVYRGCEAEVLL